MDLTTEYWLRRFINSQSSKFREKELTEKILNCAYTVHTELGA